MKLTLVFNVKENCLVLIEIGIVDRNAYRRFGFEQIRLILWGAFAYSGGALLEFFRFPALVPTVIGPHELFHVMVLIGILAHWTQIHRLARGQFAPAAVRRSWQGRTIVAAGAEFH